MTEFKHDLGREAKSKINGFKGVIVARSEHIYGCNRYHLQPYATKDGNKVSTGYWFDEDELDVGEVVAEPNNKPDGGLMARDK